MKRVEIAPGAHVTVLPGEKFKRCKFAVRLVLPGQKETATALAVLPHLLDRRCEAIPDPTDLARKLFSLYGAELASETYTLGANRVVTIGVSGLKNAYALRGEDLEDEYLDLACQLLFRPKLEKGAFAAEDVEIEKAKQADYLRSEMNDKRDYCLRQARRKLFGASPLGIESSGYLEDIEKLDGAFAYQTYTDLLRRAQVEVFAVGGDGDKAAKKVLSFLAGIDRAPEKVAYVGAIGGTGVFDQVEEPMDTVQGKLCIMCASGQVAGARDMAVMRVAGAIFGGLPTSRLFTNVREKKSLCYYCAASYAGYSGTLTIDSGVDHDKRELAAEAILHELDVMQRELVEEEEMTNAKTALKNAYTSAQDHPDALESWAFNEMLRGTNLTIEEMDALVQGVTREEVRAAMASFTPALQYAITGKEEN